MLFSNLLTTASLILLVSSSSIPSKRATFCIADWTEGDQEIIGIEKRNLRKIKPRQSDAYYCDCENKSNNSTTIYTKPTTLNRDNADIAVSEMYAALTSSSSSSSSSSKTSSLRPDSNLIFIVGDVAAYFCNFDTHEWIESGDDLDYDICEIATLCGNYVGGAYKSFNTIDGFGYTTGYMKYTPGLDVCAASKALMSQSC